MKMAVSARNLLLGLTLILLAVAGCGDGPESEPPKQLAVVRKKITIPKKQAPKAVKPKEMAAAKVAQAPVKKPKEKTPEAETAAKPPVQQQAAEKQVSPEKKPTEAAKVAQAPAKKPKEKTPEAETAAKPPVQQQAAEKQVSPEKKPEPQKAKTSQELLAKELLAKKAGKQTVYSYDPEGKPNPFQPLFATEAPQRRMAPGMKKDKEEKRLPLTPLQKINLGQLKVVGIIISSAGNKALVEEPSGKGYVITKGTYIGTNFGRVKQILFDRVIVEEEVEDFFTGGLKPQLTELELQQKEPGQV